MKILTIEIELWNIVALMDKNHHLNKFRQETVIITQTLEENGCPIEEEFKFKSNDRGITDNKLIQFCYDWMDSNEIDNSMGTSDDD